MVGLRVLLVDDEEDFLEPTAARLRRRGVECETARSGEEALEILGQKAFDVAVVDVKMPGMDGLELLRRMRRDYPNTAVVLLTGHASVELGVRGIEMGAFEYLLKPLDLDELLDVLHRAAESRT